MVVWPSRQQAQVQWETKATEADLNQRPRKGVDDALQVIRKLPWVSAHESEPRSDNPQSMARSKGQRRSC